MTKNQSKNSSEKLTWLFLILVGCAVIFLVIKEFQRAAGITTSKTETKQKESTALQMPTVTQVMTNVNTQFTRVSDNVLIAQVKSQAGSPNDIFRKTRAFIITHNMARDGSLDGTSIKEVLSDDPGNSE